MSTLLGSQGPPSTTPSALGEGAGGQLLSSFAASASPIVLLACLASISTFHRVSNCFCSIFPVQTASVASVSKWTLNKSEESLKEMPATPHPHPSLS